MPDGSLPTGCSVAIIMDGNGRWAQRRNLPVTEGHRAGGRALRRTVEAALDLGIAELTVYAFSTENWTREPAEVAGLMQLFSELLTTETPDLHKQGVQMRFLGRQDGLPTDLVAQMREAEQLTVANDRMTLAIAFNYGGRAEVVDAARKVVLAHGVDALSEAAISSALYEPSMREPDVIVRTAGELRTSNFMIWQGAYAELVFLDTLWPDFGLDDLTEVLQQYAGRERRYGGRVEAEVGT